MTFVRISFFLWGRLLSLIKMTGDTHSQNWGKKEKEGRFIKVGGNGGG